MPLTQLLYNAGTAEVVFKLSQQPVLFLVCLLWQLASEPPSCPWTEPSYLRASVPPENTTNAYRSEISQAKNL